jgi:cytochrome c5
MTHHSQLRVDPIVAAIVFLTFGASYWFLKVEPPTTSLATTTIAASAPQARGHITFEHSFFDFGTVVEGDIVKHTFKFKNDGAGSVKVLNTETSCGCTTANGALKEYAPGESGEMEVVVDTKGKKGIIVKTVTLMLEHNEAATIDIALTMKLEPPPHPKIEKMRNINAEAACKSCHLESGEGQSGVFLYHRVCAQCHGKKGMGGFARAHNDAAWQQRVDDAYLKKVIYGGLPDKGMPAFVEGVTPPLSEEQVGSLIQYIRGLVPR